MHASGYHEQRIAYGLYFRVLFGPFTRSLSGEDSPILLRIGLNLSTRYGSRNRFVTILVRATWPAELGQVLAGWQSDPRVLYIAAIKRIRNAGSWRKASCLH
jgi:hypothetical protein